jgi:hypothetical protein
MIVILSVSLGKEGGDDLGGGFALSETVISIHSHLHPFMDACIRLWCFEVTCEGPRMEVGMILWGFLFVIVGVYAVNHDSWLFCATLAFFLLLSLR